MTVTITTYDEYREKVLKLRDSLLLLHIDEMNKFYKHKIKFMNMKYIESININNEKFESLENIPLTFTDVLPNNNNVIQMYMNVSDFHSYTMASSSDPLLQNGMVYELWCQWSFDSSLNEYILKILFLTKA